MSFSTMAFCEYCQLIKAKKRNLKIQNNQVGPLRLELVLFFLFFYRLVIFACMCGLGIYASWQHAKANMVKTTIQDPKMDHQALIQLWDFRHITKFRESHLVIVIKLKRSFISRALSLEFVIGDFELRLMYKYYRRLGII